MAASTATVMIIATAIMMIKQCNIAMMIIEIAKIRITQCKFAMKRTDNRGAPKSTAPPADPKRNKRALGNCRQFPDQPRTIQNEGARDDQA